MRYMPPLHIQDTNHELNTPYLHMKSTIKSLNNFHPKHVSQRLHQTNKDKCTRPYPQQGEKTSRELMSTPSASSL